MQEQIWRAIGYTVVFCIIIFLLVTPFKARGQEISIGLGVACDTQAQVESFMAKWDGKNGSEVLKVVNDEAKNENACIASTWLFSEKKVVNPRLKTETGAWRVVEVEMWGIVTPGFQLQFPEPLTQYIALKLNEVET